MEVTQGSSPGPAEEGDEEFMSLVRRLARLFISDVAGPLIRDHVALRQKKEEKGASLS